MNLCSLYCGAGFAVICPCPNVGLKAKDTACEHTSGAGSTKRALGCSDLTVGAAIDTSWLQLGMFAPFLTLAPRLSEEVLYTASWALRWFQHHRSLTRAREAAMAAARKHNAVENNSSAMLHGMNMDVSLTM